MTLTGRGLLQRLYWGACALLLVLGVAGAVGSGLLPHERFDDAGHLIGEMPPQFGAAVALAALGVMGVLAGLAAKGLAGLRRSRRGAGNGAGNPRVARGGRMR